MPPRLLQAVALASLVACTEPDRPLTVTVAAPPRKTVTRVTESPLYVTCDYALTAHAIGGDDGDEAVWEGAVIELREGDQVTLSGTWSSTDVAGFFGSDRLVSGEVRSAMVYNGSPTFPFSVTHRFTYRVPSALCTPAKIAPITASNGTP